jgi:hypothetical protein
LQSDFIQKETVLTAGYVIQVTFQISSDPMTKPILITASAKCLKRQFLREYGAPNFESLVRLVPEYIADHSIIYTKYFDIPFTSFNPSDMSKKQILPKHYFVYSRMMLPQ